MAGDDAGDDNLAYFIRIVTIDRVKMISYRRQGNAIANLGHHGRSRTQGRRGDTVTSIAVNDQGGNQVQTDVNSLEQAERLGKVARILQLSHQAKVGGVASESEDNVADGQEALVEIGFADCYDAAAGVFDPDGDHADEDCGGDAHESWKVLV